MTVFTIRQFAKRKTILLKTVANVSGVKISHSSAQQFFQSGIRIYNMIGSCVSMVGSGKW